MRTAVLLSALAFTGLASAQIVTSGFENWTGTVPDGWEGSKTNITLTSVTQVSDNTHGGAYAVGLENTAAGHKRFTTTAVTVTSGSTYQVSYWVRGTGEIRSGLFDGRPTASGYADYSDYAVVASPGVWMQVTQTVAAAYDTTGAQFILSLRNTVGPENLVVDDVNISEGGAVESASIYDIQYTTDASGDSPYVGQTILTGGIVTAVLPDAGFFVQSGSGPWTGVYVYDTDDAVDMGDSLTFSASVSEYFNNTELSGVSGLTVVSSGNTMPAALVVETGEVALEPLESVLLQVVSASCTEAPGGANFGKYKLDDGSGFAIIGKAIYTTTPEPAVGNILTVTGVNYYSFAEYDIEPRMAADIDFTTSIAEAGVLSGVSFGPNPATDLLEINLGRAAGSNVTYTIADLQGRTVQSGLMNGQRTVLNVGSMAEGLYHLTLRSNALVKTFAVQVAH